MLNQYIVPDKSAGQTWTSGEHNVLKNVVNNAVDQVNANTNAQQANAGQLAQLESRLNPNPEW